MCIALRRGFCLATLLKPRSVDGWSDGCPSENLPHLHTGFLESSQSDYQVLGSSSGSSSPPIVQFGQATSSWLCQTSSILELLSLRNLQCSRNLFGAFPRSVPLNNPGSDICRQFPSDLIVWLLLWYAMSAVRPSNVCLLGVSPLLCPRMKV